MNKQFDTFTRSLTALRKFFADRQVTEVLTPPIVQNPGIEPHLHPIQIYSPFHRKKLELFLNTSPEFWMKWILAHAQELGSIYTLNYSFRDEPNSEWHRNQFLMLEWYRPNSTIQDIINDCQNLYQCLQTKLSLETPIQHEIKTVKQIMYEAIGADLDELLEVETLRKYIQSSFPELNSASEIDLWEDLFFLLFLNKVEPELKKYPSLFLTHFPAELAALSRLDPKDPRYCLRFEWYLNGVEIANCFNELTDLEEQKERAQSDLMKKNQLYGIDLKEPKVLYQALEMGLPNCSGIALGFERLIKQISNDPYDFLPTEID